MLPADENIESSDPVMFLIVVNSDNTLSGLRPRTRSQTRIDMAIQFFG